MEQAMSDRDDGVTLKFIGLGTGPGAMKPTGEGCTDNTRDIAEGIVYIVFRWPPGWLWWIRGREQLIRMIERELDKLEEQGTIEVRTSAEVHARLGL
jgi:hypothetical protein